VRNLVGGFGWLFGLGVVVLVARYGYISSDNEVNGAILAFLFAGLAAGGLFGHAVAVHIWRIHRGWSTVLGLICVAALVLNVSNSLGAIAGRDDKTIAQRSKVKETRADDRAEFDRLTAAIEKLPEHRPIGTVKADLDAARAGRAYKSSNGCDPEQITTKATRDACEAYRKLESELETAKAAHDLEGKAEALKTSLAKGDVVRSVNPQGAILTKLFRLPDSEADTAATWQQFAMSIVVDLLIMACFIAYEVMGWETRALKRKQSTLPSVPPASEEIALPARPVPRLVASNPPSVSIIEFAAGALAREHGTDLEFDDFYLAYWQHCKAIDGRALAPTEAVEQTNKLCAECNITIQRRGKKRFLVGVRLKSSSSAKQQRLGPMGRSR
jgi:hypothetical protein